MGPSAQIPLLCHDPEGFTGSHGVDPGHSAGWQDLHLCFQHGCGPHIFLWWVESYTTSFQLLYQSMFSPLPFPRLIWGLFEMVVVFWCVFVRLYIHTKTSNNICRHVMYAFPRYAQHHRSGCGQAHGQGPLQGRHDLSKQHVPQSRLTLRPLLLTSKGYDVVISSFTVCVICFLNNCHRLSNLCMISFLL